MDTKTDGLLKKSLHWNIPMGFVIFSTLRPQTPMEKWRFLSPKTMGLWPLKIKKHVRSHGRVFSVITQEFGTWVLDALKTGMHQAWPPERQVGFSLKCFLQIAEKMRGKKLLLDDTNGCERTVKNLRFSRCLVVFSLLNISSTYLLVGEVWLLLRNGHPWPPTRNCLLLFGVQTSGSATLSQALGCWEALAPAVWTSQTCDLLPNFRARKPTVEKRL